MNDKRSPLKLYLRFFFIGVVLTFFLTVGPHLTPNAQAACVINYWSCQNPTCGSWGGQYCNSCGACGACDATCPAPPPPPPPGPPPPPPACSGPGVTSQTQPAYNTCTNNVTVYYSYNTPAGCYNPSSGSYQTSQYNCASGWHCAGDGRCKLPFPAPYPSASLSVSSAGHGGDNLPLNFSGSNYNAGPSYSTTRFACNTSLSNQTNSVSATVTKNVDCNTYESCSESATAYANYTTLAWQPRYSAVQVSPTSAYDDQFMYLSVGRAGDTNADKFQLDGLDIPATYNGDNNRTVGNHTISFYPLHNDSCGTTTGQQYTAAHTTKNKPLPTMSNLALNKPLSYKGQPITITGTIANADLWNFFIELHYNGDANSDNYAIGRASSGEYPTATYGGTTANFSGNNFSFTVTNARETLSANAYVKISYARAGRQTGTRVGEIAQTTPYEVAYQPVISGTTIAPENGKLTLTINGNYFRIISKASDASYRGSIFINSATQAVPAMPAGNIIAWSMNQIKVVYPPVTGDVKVCMAAPIDQDCNSSLPQYFFETDSDVSAANSWWTFKTLPPPSCRVTIVKPPLNSLYVLSKKDTSDPFLVQVSWSNFDSRSPITISTVITPPGNVSYTPGSVSVTGPATIDTTGHQDGNSTTSLLAVTTQAPIGQYSMTVNASSTVARGTPEFPNGINCTADTLGVIVDVDPYLKTTGGDVHSNKDISIPGGL